MTDVLQMLFSLHTQLSKVERRRRISDDSATREAARTIGCCQFLTYDFPQRSFGDSSVCNTTAKFLIFVKMHFVGVTSGHQWQLFKNWKFRGETSVD